MARVRPGGRTAVSPGSVVGLLGVLGVAAYAGVVGWSAGAKGYDVWIALVVVPLLLLLNLPFVVRAGRADPDPRFLRLLVWVFVLKQAAAVARYLMAFVLYDGVADAAGYHGHGERLAEAYRAGAFDADLGRDLVGTGFIRLVTGIIYTVTGPSIYIGYAVFSMLGFWGLYFFYRAFRVGVPDGDARRYSLLVLLLPSMLFWPSGLGKEAWMTLGLGLSAYGCALLLTGHRRWLLPLGLGVAAAAMVRPHMAALLLVGLAVAVLLGRTSRRRTELTPVLRGLLVVLVLGGTLLMVRFAGDFLGADATSASSVDAAIDDTADQTSTGGSRFETVGVDSPLDFPWAAVTVLARPFPQEADNLQMLLASAEGLLLIVLVVAALRGWRELPGRLRVQPYLLLCLAYSALFVYAFSHFSNFGLLTRERVQVIPFVLVLLALPRPTPAVAPPAAAVPSLAKRRPLEARP